MSADNRNEAISTLAQIASPVAVWQAAYAIAFARHAPSPDWSWSVEKLRAMDDHAAFEAIREADRAVAALERWKQAKALERTKR